MARVEREFRKGFQQGWAETRFSGKVIVAAFLVGAAIASATLVLRGG